MRAVGCYIVHVPMKYEDRWETKNKDVVIYKDTTVADTFDAIRSGEVVALPLDVADCDVKIGDNLLFHHNIVFEQIMLEKRIISDFCIDENKGLYRVPIGLCYGYYREGSFSAINGYVFVAPIEVPDSDESQIIKVKTKKYIKQIGTVRYGCKELLELSVEEGDIVVFSPYSEYPYSIDGETVYRMKVKDIDGVWDKKGTYPNISLE